MKKWLLIGFVASLIAGPPLIVSADEAIAVDGGRVTAELVPPFEGYVWFTGPKKKPSHVVEHGRDFFGKEVWDGDIYLTGEMFNEVNWDANFKACDSLPCVGDVAGGNVWGTAWVDLDEFDGGWMAPFEYEISARGALGMFSFEGEWIAEGWGELEGWVIELHVEQDGDIGTEMFWGYVYPPE
jgi:hypothetical protein